MFFGTKEHVDVHYINLIGMSIEGFKSVKRNVWVGRCPVCGDSKKKKSKRRFYIYRKDGTYKVFCHNCNLSHNLWTFIKDYRSDLFQDYRKETMLDSFKGKDKRGESKDTFADVLGALDTKRPVFSQGLQGVVKCTDLPDDHEAVRYLRGRAFDNDMIERLYYADDFFVTAQGVDNELKDSKMMHNPRIVIPFYDTDGNILMIQGRSLDPKDELKYLTIKAGEDIEKVYGRYEADFSKTVYCVEGPFDSLFVDNCLATCDSSLTKVTDADVLIWDNEPRNKAIVKNISEAIEAGRKVVIWPFTPDKKYDINDMIKKGVTREQLMAMIKKNTFHGPRAKMKFIQWKRV